ncbi:MAG: cell division protein FtsZ [Colwellia sp.]
MKELINGNPEIVISVIGVGGCGCNTVHMLEQNQLSEQVNLIAVNTDLAALNQMQVSSKILIGQELTQGYGAGSDPKVGLQAAQESEELLKSAMQSSDIIIITAGFGGGTGTGASPYIAQLARELDINCLAIVTAPFITEGKLRTDIALAGIEQIKSNVHAYITLSNDLLLEGLGETIGLLSAFNESNEVLKNLLISLTQMLTQTGHVNIDKNDFSRILSYEGQSILGVGKADSEDEAFDALEQAMNNPLVSTANIESAKGVIIQLFCRNEPKLSTYNGLMEQVQRKVTNKSVLVVPGFTQNENLSSEVVVLIIASGIESDETINKFKHKNNHKTLYVNPFDEKQQVDQKDYLGETLSFVNSINPDQVSDEDEYTNIPAITRKLREQAN